MALVEGVALGQPDGVMNVTGIIAHRFGAWVGFSSECA